MGKRHKFCYYCPVRLEPHNTTVDHYIPLALGGSNNKTNLVLCCKDCNKEKGNLMPYEFTPKTPEERSSMANIQKQQQSDSARERSTHLEGSEGVPSLPTKSA